MVARGAVWDVHPLVRRRATEWGTVAKQAGMKYMVFTAKHHDRFCFWDTALTEFKISNSAAKRDTMRELAEACRRENMPLGWYYSPRDWESCLCVNGSWAFNAYDLGWKPTRQLIHELIEIVSRGGNLLLNVGPDQDGVIPAVAVGRLQEMGNWLRVNGEAIYATTAGIRDATGAWRFTRRGDVDYAITLEWPGKNIVIPGVRLRAGGTVSLLGIETKLAWENIEAGCQINVPASIHTARPSAHAWVFQLTGGAESL